MARRPPLIIIRFDPETYDRLARQAAAEVRQPDQEAEYLIRRQLAPLARDADDRPPAPSQTPPGQPATR
jgi:hypothetical protein